MVANNRYETIIIGGSFAGLQAGMTLGRSLRRVLIIDSGLPCNRQTPHSHNFITHDGKKPAQLAAEARQQVLQYDTVEWLNGLAVQASAFPDGFMVTVQSGEVFTADRLLFATGVKDHLFPLPGFAACWGISVIHCPYCHGYENRHKPTGILANGDMALHYAALIRQLTGDITIYTNGPSTLSAEHTQLIQQKNIAIVTKQLKELIHHNGQLQSLVFTNGSSIELTTLYARPPFEQHCHLPQQLGCALTETGLLQTDNLFQTTVSGVYAAGDCMSPLRAVANAVAAGLSAGAFINRDLTEKAFHLQ